MKDVTLLLTETDDRNLGHSKDYLAQRHIKVVPCSRDGHAAYEAIVEQAPTCALLDLFMPGMDAISLKQKFNKENQNGATHFFAMGAVQDDLIESELMRHGYHFYFLKPFDVSSLFNWITNTTRAGTPLVSTSPNEAVVTDILREIGVPAHVKGHRYLREAILMVADDPSLIYAVTKALYPALAYKHQTESTRVERAIRNAIEITWSRGGLDILDKYFGSTVDYTRGRPTNREFIAMLADHIQINKARQAVSVN